MSKFVIIGCGAAKRDSQYGKKWPARDLYTSTYFAKKREFAETFADQWAILSAEHGLVWPDQKHRPASKVRNRAERLTDSVAEERRSVSVIEPGHVFDPTIASPGLKVCPRGQEGDLLDAAVGDGTVLVLPALNIPVFDEVFEPVADGASARVVLLLELHDEIGNHVTAVGNHLFEEFVRQRRLSRSRHTVRCSFGHHNVDHTAKNHSSCPRGEELCIVGHTGNNMEATA